MRFSFSRPKVRADDARHGFGQARVMPSPGSALGGALKL
jgi:hypothetical protein